MKKKKSSQFSVADIKSEFVKPNVNIHKKILILFLNCQNSVIF